jgi:glycosidase
MSEDITEHLTFLYGAETARRVEPRFLELLRRHGWNGTTRPPAAERSLPLTQRDALLITYGDQVREEGEPPLATLAGFLGDHATGAISGVHVLPFFPSSSDDGFSVVDYQAVDPALGTWDDLARVRSRFDMMFDAVFNHCSAESDWFRRFVEWDEPYRGWFITVDGDPDLSQVVRPRALPLLTTFETAAGDKKVWTTFSADQVDVNARDPGLLLALVEVLLTYVGRGARFVRLDAIGYLWKEIGTTCIHLPQTHRVVQLMRTILDLVAPDALLITETNVPHRDNISYFGDGSNEAQLVYNFALPPLVLHSLSTGSARALSGWAGSLELPSRAVAFFNFLASHDGIGVNPVRGILGVGEIAALVSLVEAHGGFVSYKNDPDGSQSPYELNVNYFDALSDPGAGEPLQLQVDRFLTAHAIQLSLAGMPGIYFHSLFGSRGDREGAERSGIKRRINRQKLTRRELERELADPSSRRSLVLAGFRRLMATRRSSAAFDPRGGQQVLDLDPRVFAIRRTSPDGREHALCLHNVSGDGVAVQVDGQRFELQAYEARWVLGAGVPAAGAASADQA